MKYKIPLRDISGGGTVAQTLNCPIGPTYRQLLIQQYYAGGTNTIAGAATNIREIRMLLNNRVQRKFSGTQLRDLNLFNGTQYDCVAGEVPNTAPGVTFPIFLAEPFRKDLEAQEFGKWYTAGLYANMQIEVDLVNAATLTCWAWVDDSKWKGTNPPMITKILPAVIPAGGTKFDYTMVEQSGFLTQLSLYPDSGASNPITPLTVFKGNAKAYDAVTTTSNRATLIQHDMVPGATGRTASIYDAVFDLNDDISEAIPLNPTRDVQLVIEAGGAMSGTVTAIVQRIGYPE
jgi:hypothetical protein